MSNRDRLVEAGLIDPYQELTSEQTQAIESLTTGEVNQLISVNEQLGDRIQSDAAVIEMPGRNPNPPMSRSTSKGEPKGKPKTTSKGKPKTTSKSKPKK